MNRDLSSYWQVKYRKECAKSWDLFYKRNQQNFFKDRHWPVREFPFLLSARKLLEVGCGVGNFLLPLIEANKGENFEVWACDFSSKAIDILKENPLIDSRCNLFVADITKKDCFATLGAPIEPDVLACIFVLSAIPPEALRPALCNILSQMGPGTTRLVIRDYCRGDAAEKRFKGDRRLGPNLYVRQDGTLAYYFELSELVEIMTEIGHIVESAQVVASKTVNVAKGIDEARFFIQTIAIKPT